VALADELTLIQGAQAGDKQAFAVLVERYWERLYRWLYHLTHDRHAAEDLTQESFLRAFSRLASFQAGTNFQAWLFRIAFNALANQRRAARRVRQSFPDNLPGPERGPAETAMTREAFQRLTRAVGRLPTDYRAAFLLRIEGELSFREIAGVLNISEETARWRVFKARQKLLDIMRPFLTDAEP
jgi:RNA polymerase sigma-70 factor (ECF subfamily)